MKVMYIASMFHTNQVPIIKGWMEAGDTPIFVCHTKGVTENHTYIEPIVLGFSIIFKLLNLLHKKYMNIRDPYTSFPEAFEGKFGFPSAVRFYNLLKNKRPDIVIIRDRSIYSILCYLVCRAMKIKTILYNQTPYWNIEKPKKDLIHKLIYKMTPEYRITPVFGIENQGEVDKKSFYVPFVINPKEAPTEKVYFKEDRINILCVGKYEERKNQIMLLEILHEFLPKYKFHLTLVGESSTLHHKHYYNQVMEYIEKHGMSQIVSCYKNCKPSDMDQYYREADLFVLPSTKEFASFSQIEAMSFSVPSIVSDSNGTACYIKPGITGELFKDNDKNSLEETIEKLLSDRALIIDMGKMAYEGIKIEYGFKQYKESITKIFARL